MLRTCDFIFYMIGTMVSDMVICKLQVLKPQQDSWESHRLLKKGELWPITARNKNPNYYLVKKIIIYAESDNYEGEKKWFLSEFQTHVGSWRGTRYSWGLGLALWPECDLARCILISLAPLSHLSLCSCSEVILPRAVAVGLRKSFCALPLLVPSSAGAPGWSTGGFFVFFRSDSPLFIAWKSGAGAPISSSPEKSGDSKITPRVWRSLGWGGTAEPTHF